MCQTHCQAWEVRTGRDNESEKTPLVHPTDDNTSLAVMLAREVLGPMSQLFTLIIGLVRYVPQCCQKVSLVEIYPNYLLPWEKSEEVHLCLFFLISTATTLDIICKTNMRRLRKVERRSRLAKDLRNKGTAGHWVLGFLSALRIPDWILKKPATQKHQQTHTENILKEGLLSLTKGLGKE